MKPIRLEIVTKVVTLYQRAILFSGEMIWTKLQGLEHLFRKIS